MYICYKTTSVNSQLSITRNMNFHNNASQILKVRPLNITLPQKQKTLKKLLILKVTFS